MEVAPRLTDGVSPTADAQEARGAADRRAWGNVCLLVPAAPRLPVHRQKLLASHSKGEIDLIGFDGDTLVFVEVRTRATEEGKTALPELSITREKHHVLIRTAHYFLRERHIGECPLRFDVVAIDNRPGLPPVVRLHKAALSPEA